ncbi:hypothetical protein CPB84DRAFT_1772529 [Gymnopilus junonius]|uniref:Uncharacterized protein n=1 Tax=Gymnopilus junonius TaxID=109634 RepID=A0A9P5NUM4_GYMJU|nr:hypothetical protein CPB84DRAFT_1772529 [Gymnopilus junonius]
MKSKIHIPGSSLRRCVHSGGIPHSLQRPCGRISTSARRCTTRKRSATCFPIERGLHL